MLRFTLLLGVVCLFSACASSPPHRVLSEMELATPATLLPGDPAPPLAVSRWVRGEPFAGYQPGTVYVVDRWASWCGPCLASMPRTSRLQAKHGGLDSAGPLVIVGVTTIDPNNGVGDVKRAVRRYDPKFRIAVDDAGKTAEGYAVAAREMAVPRSFVIDQRGRLAWIGHPADLEPVIESVLAGTWDLDKAAAEALRKNQSKAESRALAREYLAALPTAEGKAGDVEAQLRAAERVIRIPVADVDWLSPDYWGWTARVQALVELGRTDDAKAAAAEAAVQPGVRDQPMAMAALSDSLLRMDAAEAAKYTDRGLALVAEMEGKTPADEWEQYLHDGEMIRNASVRISAASVRSAQSRHADAAELLRKAIAAWPNDRRMLPNKAQLRERLEREEKLAASTGAK